MELNGKMIEEGFDFFLTVPKIGPAPHLMKEHIALYPCTVASLGAYRIVSTPHRVMHLIEKHTCHGAPHFPELRQIIDKILDIANRQIRLRINGWLRQYHMSYCYIENLKELPEVNELKIYYALNIVEVAKILRLSKEEIPKDIALYFEPLHFNPETPASYNRQEKQITYRYETANSLLEDKGRLIHEATHVVQDYPFHLPASPCMWCGEGIADYCRLRLDKDFHLKDNLSRHDIKRNSQSAALFLTWLSKLLPSIAADLNSQIRCSDGKLNCEQVISQLLGKDYSILECGYICGQHDYNG